MNVAGEGRTSPPVRLRYDVALLVATTCWIAGGIAVDDFPHAGVWLHEFAGWFIVCTLATFVVAIARSWLS